MNYCFIICFLFIVASTGCTSSVEVTPNDYTYAINHLIALKGDGEAFGIEEKAPEDGEATEKYKGLEEHTKAIIKNIQAERGINPNRKRILIYVHGGLKGIQGSVDEAIILSRLMEREHEHHDDELYYPILINWESGMGSAYIDHLFRIRQGKEAPILGAISSPFYFLADIGRALFRYPVTMGVQIYRGLTPVPVPTQDEVASYNRQFFTPEPDPHQILLGQNKINRFSESWFQDRVTLFVPGVIRFVTTPVLDVFGKAGWDNMVRRTKTVFRKPSEFVPSDLTFRGEVQTISGKMKGEAPPTLNPRLKPEDSRPTGGLAVLMEKLRDLKSKKRQEDYSITLIGHSMGTLILNDLIRLYGDSNLDFPIDEIVYLAAACTIRDFEKSVIPYLRKNPLTKFYNLTLHPYGDAREKTYGDFLPRGSLLEWIDDFASNPSTFTYLTLGKWNNAIMALHVIPPAVRDQVTLKGFGIQDPEYNHRPHQGEVNEISYNKPQRHSHLNDSDQLFWRPDYWKKPISK